ncbi:hypothetical protein OIO90_002553 [Microbotryomycetes sp. JL221]|nr:hypothetical protein OIO90_002553 [Microbotryomycetes sp. JL221]
MDATLSLEDAQQSQAQNRVTKRKIDDVMSSLDASLSTTTTTASSLLTSTKALGKRKRRSDDLTQGISTPLLVSLLPSRTTRHAPHPTPAPPTYNPTSLPSLLERISTYKLTTFTLPKPRSLSASQCSMWGWQSVSPGKDRIQCVTCGSTLIISPGSTTSWSSNVGTKIKTELETQLRTAHSDTCPWRMRGCSSNLYRLNIGGKSKELQGLRDKVANMTKAGIKDVKVSQLESVETEDLDKLVQLVQNQLEDHVPRELVILALLEWDCSSLSSSTTRLQTFSCRWCCRQLLASSYMSTSSTSGEESPSSRALDAIAQHQPFCPVVDVTRDDDGCLAVNNAVSNTIGATHKNLPAWKLRLDALLQRDVRPRSSIDSISSFVSLNDVPGETRAEKERNKTKALVSYVRELLGSTSKIRRG